MFQKVWSNHKREKNVKMQLLFPSKMVFIPLFFFKTKGAHDNPKVNAIIVLKGSPERKFVSHWNYSFSGFFLRIYFTCRGARVARVCSKVVQSFKRRRWVWRGPDRWRWRRRRGGRWGRRADRQEESTSTARGWSVGYTSQTKGELPAERGGHCGWSIRVGRHVFNTDSGCVGRVHSASVLFVQALNWLFWRKYIFLLV